MQVRPSDPSGSEAAASVNTHIYKNTLSPPPGHNPNESGRASCDLLTVPEAAAGMTINGKPVDDQFVYALAREDQIPNVRRGRSVFVPENWFELLPEWHFQRRRLELEAQQQDVQPKPSVITSVPQWTRRKR